MGSKRHVVIAAVIVIAIAVIAAVYFRKGNQKESAESEMPITEVMTETEEITEAEPMTETESMTETEPVPEETETETESEIPEGLIEDTPETSGNTSQGRQDGQRPVIVEDGGNLEIIIPEGQASGGF